MSPKHTYFRYTTPQQRKLLFETWESTGNAEEACRKARVSLRLFYYWKPRFAEKGYAGLEEFESRVAHKLNRKAKEIEQQVIQLRREHPDWGKARITHEMAKANNWVPLISPNTVKRILQAAQMWPERESGEKKSL
jgi:transposase